ncbi:unnamed protein product [Effrenium voratum]|nr:unnamed protein product [Effrenium voratum]
MAAQQAKHSREDLDDQYGLHADHPAWQSAKKLMIRNIPSRCSHAELEFWLRTLTSSAFQLSLPVNSSGRNRGYAFVASDPTSLRGLVRALWQQRLPSRMSTRALKLQPGNSDMRQD